jgi:hypothetical protein
MLYTLLKRQTHINRQMHPIEIIRTMRLRSAGRTRPIEPIPRPLAALRRRAALAASALLLAASLPALLHAAPPETPAQDTLSAPTVPARNWAVDCANNEILIIQHPNSYFRYRMHVVDEKGDQLRDQIETPEGSVARLIQRDGRALTHDEDSAERDRLNYLLNSPSVFARHIKNEASNKKLGVDLLKLMPDAMLWSYTPNQPQPPNQPASADAPPLVVLDFKPNPKWSPPTIPSESLTGLEGRVWIDPHTRNMVRLEGDVFQPVNIGWGMVGHIYPGGKVLLEQASASPQRWVVEHIDMQFSIRVLMLKTVKIHTHYDTPASSFQAVPTMTYQQAIKILLDTPLPAH